MTLIKEATPLLERDLGWGSYLTNLLKSITNVLFKVITFGKNSSFFTLTHSESLKAVEDAQGQLKLKL